MRRISPIKQTVSIGLAMAGLLCALMGIPVQAEMAIAPSLVISQIKITSSNGQFVTLYNASNATLDMSKYQLEYFNSYDLSKATSSRLISLQGTLPPHSYYQLNDSSLLLCYQLTIDSMSLGFSSTAGFVEVLGYNQLTPGGSVVPTTQDFVGWSKSAAAGAQTLPASTNAFLQRQPTDLQHHPLVSSPGVGSWLPVQPDPANNCSLVTYAAYPSSVQTGLIQLLPSSEPPARIEYTPADTLTDTSLPTAVFPAADIGLMAPKITEVLPNPLGTGNDTTDEYIELYNPNPVAFDLTGFVLQTGLSTTRNYTFPSGSTLTPQSFTAFYSEATGLSLSNIAGQARLLDPFSSILSSSDQYSGAKDGQTWALANGKWYYTTTATPNAANVIKLPTLAKKKTTSTTKTTSKTSKKVTVKSTKPAKKTTSFASASKPATAPVHFWVLALVAGAAVLYGAYEYRTDMANRVHQLRRYLANRRGARQ